MQGDELSFTVRRVSEAFDFCRRILSPQIVSVREHPVYLRRAIDYFASVWDIDHAIYRESISDAVITANRLPRWYIMLRGNKIIGCYGLIENDFMVRRDLSPWLCALYIGEDERGRALGSKLLTHGRQEAAKLGFDTVYLCTDHVGYYEKYGWRFIGLSESLWGGMTRVYQIEIGNHVRLR
ncbi:MAG: GNAT family N-acetyltransferase [Eubacteriales bacterium]|jgi:N-acetylglutamate synthase-like GNAT family acetyltransferase|nr:GNAT family N-acetyltransferase [Eubacteriales bacterium]